MVASFYFGGKSQPCFKRLQHECLLRSPASANRRNRTRRVQSPNRTSSRSQSLEARKAQQLPGGPGGTLEGLAEASAQGVHLLACLERSRADSSVCGDFWLGSKCLFLNGGKAAFFFWGGGGLKRDKKRNTHFQRKPSLWGWFLEGGQKVNAHFHRIPFNQPGLVVLWFWSLQQGSD